MCDGDGSRDGTARPIPAIEQASHRSLAGNAGLLHLDRPTPWARVQSDDVGLGFQAGQDEPDAIGISPAFAVSALSLSLSRTWQNLVYAMCETDALRPDPLPPCSLATRCLLIFIIYLFPYVRMSALPGLTACSNGADRHGTHGTGFPHRPTPIVLSVIHRDEWEMQEDQDQRLTRNHQSFSPNLKRNETEEKKRKRKFSFLCLHFRDSREPGSTISQVQQGKLCSASRSAWRRPREESLTCQLARGDLGSRRIIGIWLTLLATKFISRLIRKLFIAVRILFLKSHHGAAPIVFIWRQRQGWREPYARSSGARFYLSSREDRW